MADSALGRGRRVLYGGLDQVFSSASNGLIMFAIAVQSTPESFAVISLIMTGLVALLGAQRGAFGTPMLLLADREGSRVRQEGSHALLVAGLAGCVIAVPIALFWEDYGLSAFMLSASAPVLLAQDILRYLAIADARPRVAALWDGVWFVGTGVLLVLAWLDGVTVAMVIASWGVLGLVALLGMMAELRILPVVRGIVAWAKKGWHHRLRYGLDASIEQTTLFIVLAMAAALVSASAGAALRGATVLLAPVGILAAALQLLVISESTRASSQPRAVWFSLLRLVAAISCVTLVFGVTFTFLPARLGHYLLGESFSLAQHVVPVVTVEYIAASLTFSIGVFLKTFNRSSDALRFKIGVMAVTLIFSGCAALIGQSALSVAIGLAVGTTVSGGIGLAIFVPWRHRRRVASVDIAD